MKSIRVSLKIFLFLTLLCGVIYPLLITMVGQVVFHAKANGSLIAVDNYFVGSKLIGQQFDSLRYFTSRPSVNSYNPLPSGGSNFGLTNSRLKELVVERKKQFILFNQTDSLTAIPAEMLFASASGLDPDISPEAARLQVARIVKVRKLDDNKKQELLSIMNKLTENHQLLILGETRINVLELNLELDRITKK